MNLPSAGGAGTTLPIRVLGGIIPGKADFLVLSYVGGGGDTIG